MRKYVSPVALFSILSAVGCSGGPGDTQGVGALSEGVAATSAAKVHDDHVTVSVEWNEAALSAIRASGAGPTVAARALAEVHTAAYDAWTAYSPLATPTQPSVARRPASERTDAHKKTAMSYAAYRVLVDLFPSAEPSFRSELVEFGGSPGNTTLDPSTPAGIGNAAAAAIIAFRHADASNQLGDITPGAYSDYTGYAPVNTPTTVNDPNRWQPLLVGGQTQAFVTPQWSNVIPFALTDPTAFRPPPPALSGTAAYLAQAKTLLDLSAGLNDRRKVIAEYWSDGPGTAQAPGHWLKLAEVVSGRDEHRTDDDAKLFFALGSAMLDTSIAVWESKRFYDYVRPITAVHVLFGGKNVSAWGGPNQGTRTIDGAHWQPYEATDEVTPASPEDAAEESAFAFAAATVLREFTGGDEFGADHVAEERSSRVEPGRTPRHDVRLCWRTFDDAATQAGFAGQLRGVHFPASDLAGRSMGKSTGELAWTKVLTLLDEKHPGGNHHRRHIDCGRDGEE